MSGNETENGRLVFIGAGNMAEALVSGILDASVVPAGRVTVTDIEPARLEHFRTTYGVTATADNREAVQDAGAVILAVKPQVLGDVLTELGSAAPAGARVISIAAGVRTGKIEAALAAGQRVVRVMPNTPCLVKVGASAIAPGAHADAADLAYARSLLEAVGIVVEVEEADLDAVTALSGSGPAYVFYLIEAMLEAAAELGLDEGKARTLAIQTVEGAARLVSSTGDDPAELRRRVTSKGGTTERAIGVFEDQKMRRTIVDALRAACERSRELAAMG